MPTVKQLDDVSVFERDGLRYVRLILETGDELCLRLVEYEF
ncbi:hypothetical protein A9K97_gp442 [Tokyovirus A1]|nr:hypothetical protein A9K97_gp442 [Tokyovirus A1]BAU79909.1 hypothetical protein [Tokyovirus A1]